MTKRYIYCYQCGTKNDAQNVKCTKCKTRLEEEEHELRDYIFDKIKGKTKGKVKDKLTDTFKSFVKRHLYGIIVTISILFGGSAAILNASTSKPQVDKTVSVPNSYEFTVMSVAQTKCEDTIEDGECYHITKSEAKPSSTCEEDYTLVADTCQSIRDFPKVSEQFCEVPSSEIRQDATSRVIDGRCMVNVCQTRVQPGEEAQYPQHKVGDCLIGEEYEVDFTTQRVCPDGTREIGGVCKRVAAPKTEYTCEEGTLEDKNCIVKEKIESKHTCEQGYTYNELIKYCIKD